MGSARRWLVVAGIAVVVVLVAAGLWLVLGGERAQQSSEQEARERLGSTPTSSVTVAPGTPPLTSGPATGVYRYRGTGTETTSFPPLTEQQGPGIAATVTAGPDGCWVFRVDYNTHHWQDWTYCTANGELTEKGGTTFSRRVFGTLNVDNTSTFTCEPTIVVLEAADQPGATRPRSCTGTSTMVAEPATVAGTMTVVGDEAVDVGGRSVPAVHVRYDTSFGGSQSGVEQHEYWFATSTGMPLRNERHIVVHTNTAIGQVTYTEDGTFTLQSIDPV